MSPFISIIVTSYNKGKYLDACLESIFEQNYVDWECIIINDGSSDNTTQISLKWVSIDKRYKYIAQTNKGVCAAKNIGIENAISKWILPIDGDDKISKDYCFNALDYLKSNEFSIVYGNVCFFDQKEGLWDLPEFDLSNLAKYNMLHNSCFFKKQDWENVKGYDVKMVHGLEDWEFWISISKSDKKFKQLNSIGFYYRIINSSRTTMLDSNKKDEMLRYMEKKHFDFFYKNLGSKVLLYKENHDLKSRFLSKYYLFYNRLIEIILKIRK